MMKKKDAKLFGKPQRFIGYCPECGCKDILCASVVWHKGKRCERVEWSCGRVQRSDRKRPHNHEQCLRKPSYLKKVKAHNAFVERCVKALRKLNGPKKSKDYIVERLQHMKGSTRPRRWPPRRRYLRNRHPLDGFSAPVVRRRMRI